MSKNILSCFHILMHACLNQACLHAPQNITMQPSTPFSSSLFLTCRHMSTHTHIYTISSTYQTKNNNAMWENTLINKTKRRRKKKHTKALHSSKPLSADWPSLDDVWGRPCGWNFSCTLRWIPVNSYLQRAAQQLNSDTQKENAMYQAPDFKIFFSQFLLLLFTFGDLKFLLKMKEKLVTKLYVQQENYVIFPLIKPMLVCTEDKGDANTNTNIYINTSFHYEKFFSIKNQPSPPLAMYFFSKYI